MKKLVSVTQIIPGLLIFALIFCAQGCNSNNKGSKVNESQVQTIKLNNLKQYEVDSIPIEDIKLIRLETNSNCLIGQVEKIIICNEKIYILDSKYAKMLIVFGMDGKFLFKVGKKGKGPQECTNLNYFDVDADGNLYLHDQGGNKILKYDSNGRFLKEYKYSFYASNFCVINSDLFTINIGNHVKNEKENTLYYWKPSTQKIIKSFLPYQGQKIASSGWFDKFHRSGRLYVANT